jgi:hypothetical protein
MMPDGYGFLRSSIIIILHLQMIFIYRHLKLDYLVLKLETLKKMVRPPKEGENFSIS